MGEFVGAERARLVDELESEFELCRTNAEVRLVCLTGGIGIGKTRTVREFYRRLQSSHQPGGAYWPADFPVQGTGLLKHRKVIHPANPTPAPGSTMPWLWWGIRCEEDSSGRKIGALFNDREQLVAHLSEFINNARRRNADMNLVVNIVGELIGMVPIVGQYIGAAYSAKELGPKVFRRFKEALDRGAARRGTATEPKMIQTSDNESPVAFEPELEFIRRFITPELPLVLVIDDAHDADTVTMRFVRALTELRTPVLVLATSWPSKLTHQAAIESGEPIAARGTFGGVWAALEEGQPARVRTVELNPIPAGEIAEIVDDFAPATSQGSRDAIVESSGGNPLVLELQLSSSRVSDSVVDGAITLPESELKQLSAATEHLIGDRFLEMDSAGQRWLAEAAHQGTVFFPGLLSSAGGDGLPAEIFEFVRIRTDNQVEVGRFLEVPLHVVVKSHAKREFSRATEDAWERHWLAAFGDLALDDDRGPQDPANRAAYFELFTQFATRPDAGIEAEQVVIGAIEWSRAEGALSETAQEDEAIVIAGEWLARGAHAPILDVAQPIRKAYSRYNRGEFAEAIPPATLARQRCMDLSQLDSSYYPLAMEALCSSLAKTGESKRARELATEFREWADRQPSIEPRIDALRVEARVESSLGNDEAESAALQQAIELAKAQDPVDFELLIDLQSDLLVAPVFGAKPDAWAELADAAEMQLGRGHWLHMFCLRNLVEAYASAMDTRAARLALDKMIAIEPTVADSKDVKALESNIRAVEGDAGAALALIEMASGDLADPLDTIIIRWIGHRVGGTARPDPPDPADDAAVEFDEWCRLLDHDVNAALAEADRRLSDPTNSATGLMRLGIIKVATDALTRRFLADCQLADSDRELLSKMVQLLQADDSPELHLIPVKILIAALEVLDSGDSQPRSGAPGGSEALEALCFAAAWSAREAYPEMEEELARARAIAADATIAPGMRVTIADMHRRLGSKFELEQQVGIAGREEMPIDLRLSAAARAAVLYRANQQSSTAIQMLEPLWTDPNPEAGVDAQFGIGLELALNYTDRDAPGDRDRMVAIRREILDGSTDPVLNAINRSDLAEALEEDETELIELVRLLAQVHPDGWDSTRVRTSVLLHRLGFRNAALAVSIENLARDPAAHSIEGLPRSLQNLIRLSDATPGVNYEAIEKFLRENNLTSIFDDEAATDRSNSRSSSTSSVPARTDGARRARPH